MEKEKLLKQGVIRLDTYKLQCCQKEKEVLVLK